MTAGLPVGGTGGAVLRPALLGAALLALGAAAAMRADDAIDRLDSALTVSALQGEFRARLSGTLDLEGYQFTSPSPGLIDAEGDSLFNPRLAVFLDAQLGTKFYAFAQARVDRGFDPSNDGLRVRLDEYAVRFTPGPEGRFNVQVGKFATVVGNWVPRHGSWEDAFVTAPLPYENLTGVWDVVAARSAAMLLNWAHIAPPLAPGEYDADKYLRLPIIWGPNYTSGVSVFGGIDRLTYALELKNAALSSRPAVWNEADRLGRQPTVSGRVGWAPDEMWQFGFSASSGPYLREDAGPTLAPGYGLGDYRETVLAQDAAFAWHHFQFWAESYEARFAIPEVGDADTVAYYGEVRYAFAPRWSAAVRWNQQFFSDLPDGAGGQVPWSPEKWRIDLAPTFRLTAHAEFKLQYSLEHDAIGPRRYGNLWATQLVVRF